MQVITRRVSIKRSKSTSQIPEQPATQKLQSSDRLKSLHRTSETRFGTEPAETPVKTPVKTPNKKRKITLPGPGERTGKPPKHQPIIEPNCPA